LKDTADIKQEHQASVTRDEVESSSVLLRFSADLGAKRGVNGASLPPWVATYLGLKACKEQSSDRNGHSLRLLCGWAGEHGNSEHPGSPQVQANAGLFRQRIVQDTQTDKARHC